MPDYHANLACAGRPRSVFLKQGVETHLCVSSFHQCVEKLFWEIILWKEHANLSLEQKDHNILSQICVTKMIYFLNVLPTKKVENLCPIQHIKQCYVDERIRLCQGFRLKFGKRSKFLIVWSLLKQVIS
jgi:hypothetical protein